MAVRREDLPAAPGAVVVDFPVRIARDRARRARRTMVLRRVAAIGLALGLTGGVIVSSAVGQPAKVLSRPGAPETVVAQPGETLWDLAERYAADGSDAHAWVDEVAALNGVQGVVPPGTELELP